VIASCWNQMDVAGADTLPSIAPSTQPLRWPHRTPDVLFIHPMPTAVTAPNLPARKRPVIARLGTMTQQSYQAVALDDSRPNPSIRLLIAMKLIATPLAQSTATTMHQACLADCPARNSPALMPTTI